jgi:nicotinate-nucleotide adenylyltransferase
VHFGIYGGSFDPVHVGHVATAEGVRAARGLDGIFLIPADAPPHKGGCLAPFADRLEMVRLAVAGHEGLEVLDLEGGRAPSYTVDTVAALRDEHPAAELELLVGADMLEDLPRWRRVDELLAMVRVVAFDRPGVDAAAAQAAFRARFGPGSFLWLDLPPVDASSTEIRRRLAAGEPVEEWLDPAVRAYIRRHGLYPEGS